MGNVSMLHSSYVSPNRILGFAYDRYRDKPLPKILSGSSMDIPTAYRAHPQIRLKKVHMIGIGDNESKLKILRKERADPHNKLSARKLT